jgi:hypothetical protein
MLTGRIPRKVSRRIIGNGKIGGGKKKTYVPLFQIPPTYQFNQASHAAVIFQGIWVER